VLSNHFHGYRVPALSASLVERKGPAILRDTESTLTNRLDRDDVFDMKALAVWALAELVYSLGEVF